MSCFSFYIQISRTNRVSYAPATAGAFFIYFLFDNSLLALYFCRLTLIL